MIDQLNAAFSDRYTVQHELGRGGMATVFLADDLRHGRQVAIKVLHPELAAVLGPERFLKEIEIAAGLTHPHILPLHDSGEADGLLYYVMPYVEGESLRDRLDRETQLSIEDTVSIASEVADALSYAHDRDVVHRDIKPANIMLSGGHALIADFGIARAVSEAGGTKLTETGLSLGTPHYMSPEQASGSLDVDGRSDVYALGCVTYEMVVGEPPHSGPNAQAIIAKVLTQPVPSLREGRETVTPAMDAAVHKALARLPADRFASAKAFGEALRQSSDPMISGVSFPAAPAARSTGDRTWKGLAIAMAVVALGALLFAWAPWRGSVPSGPGTPDVYRLAIPTGTLAVTGHAPSPALALSPDGSQLAYVAGDGGIGQIFLRHLGSSTATPVPGGESAHSPFFSPDGEWLAFVADGQLAKVRLSDGTMVTLTPAEQMHGGHWSADGTIVFGATAENSFGLSRISADGGEPETVLAPGDTEGMFLLYPTLLPDGDHVLFTSANGSGHSVGVSVVSLSTGEVTTLFSGGGVVRYLPTGHLLYSQTGGLFAVRFDLDAVAIEGTPVRVVQDAQVEFPVEPTIAHFAVSANGTLVYLAGSEATELRQQLVWADRSGDTEIIRLSQDEAQAARRGTIFGPRLSPDGRRVVFWSNDPRNVAGEASFNGMVWVSDLERGTMSLITADSMQNFWSVWTPDGRNVVSTGGGLIEGEQWVGLYSRRIEGSGPPVALTHAQGSNWQQPYSFTEDGSLLLFQQSEEGINHDLWVLPMAEGSDPWPFLATQADEYHPAISSDGRWLAYTSNESGRDEVYLSDFPEGRTRLLVSTAGGSSPAWDGDGAELFYLHQVEAQAAVMSVSVSVSGEDVRLGRPVELFRGPFVEAWMPFGRFYDVTPDGQRFLMVRRPEQDRSLERVVVVLNWLEELESRVGS
jgi:serine/threonine-protein kinase